MFSRDKGYRLFGLFVIQEEKMFLNIQPEKEKEIEYLNSHFNFYIVLVLYIQGVYPLLMCTVKNIIFCILC
jgi:hypothetical protein